MKRLGVLFLVLAATALTLAGPPQPTPPDLLFYGRNVATDLHTRCAGCHSDPESAGRYLLEPLGDLQRPDRAKLLKNYRATLAFLDAEAPAESPLLKKALGESGHTGGAIYTSKTAADYRALLDFAMGATLTNRPPEAIVQKRYDTRVGEDLEIDGTLSGDPEGQSLGYRWSLLEKPIGSLATLLSRDGSSPRIKADKAGLYRIELSVSDGELWSLPASLLVVAKPAPVTVRKDADGADMGASDMGGMDTPKPAKRDLLERRLDPARLRLIRRMFFDLKWRSPRLDEIEMWYGRSHRDTVKAFLEDEEVWDAWYERQLFYFLLLDRFRPTEGPLATIPARLTARKITMTRAVEEIVRSQYFNARNPGNDTFVTVVLEQCLGMVVQERKNKSVLEAGKKMYDGYRVKLFKEKGDSQADFVRLVFRQEDFYRHLLTRSWKDLLGSEIDKKRLEAWVARATSHPGGFREVYEEWLTGVDYVEAAARPREKPEIPYVRALFLDTLDRLPSYQELRNVRNAFLSLADPTPIRLVMGRVLLESDQARMPVSAIDPARFVREQFLRLFARQATEKELVTFVDALKNDPAVTPRVVLYTLISSPEYQSY